MFELKTFMASFEGNLNALQTAEKITRSVLCDLSRDLLSVVFESEDIGYINRTLEVLTPMNKQTAILFFKQHSGFLLSDETQKFYKKDKKNFDDVKDTVLALLEDPHFNIWSWAERNVEIVAKPFDVSKVTAFAQQAIKKAAKDGISQADVLAAFFAGGFEAETLLAALEKIAA